jgi:hypothetical protein
MRNLTLPFVLTLSAKALMISGASALPYQFNSGVEGGNRGGILIDDPLTWIRGRSCPYGLTVVAKRYNRKLRIWQVKCAS